jgi:TonB-linked SusC/RagA family outer membrane protein
MKKKSIIHSSWVRKRMNVIFLKMKLLTILIFTGSMVFSANTYSQRTKIDLQLKNSSLTEILNSIEKESEFIFIYNEKVVDFGEKKSISVRDENIERVLDLLFLNTGITYRIDDRQVFLYKDDENQMVPIDKNTETEQPKEIKISGEVADSKGLPIPGATVVIKGTTIGIITDNDGHFSLSLPVEYATGVLAVSFVGYQTREITIGSQRDFKVVLSEQVIGVDEVVVVGYGMQKRESVTGAISTVDPEKLEQSSSSNLGSALAGRLSGLTSMQSSGGQPGRDDATIYLRGISTLNDANPLIIVDGVPRDNIRQINPSEIASVSTLKDASATAVFGVRGANGVIIITTKRGDKGRAKMKFKAEQGYSSLSFEPERLHSVEFLNLQNEAANNDGVGQIWSNEVIAKYENPLIGLDPSDPNYETEVKKRRYMYPDHDYYREFISRYTPETRLNADVSGGSDKLSYYINAGFIYQGGNLKTEPESQLGYDSSMNMRRYSFRSNLDYQVSESFSAFLNLSSNIETVNMPYNGVSIADMILNAQHIWPITPGPTTINGFDVPAGQVVDVTYLTNPTFESMNRRGYTRESTSILNASLGMNWDLGKLITPGLSISGIASTDTRSRSTLSGSKKELTYITVINYETDELQFVINNDQETLLSLSKSSNSRYTINLQGKINYSRQFDKHKVDAMVLAQRDYWESYASEIPYNMIGVSSRVSYDYDNRYFGEFNMGYNGSEQFAKGNRFGFFPAVSAGWVLTNEKFLHNHPILTYLKLRSSLGKVGNDKIADERFLYMDNIEMGTGPLKSLGNGKGVSQGLMGNPSLSWEEAVKQNYGLDLGIMEDLRISFDYYKEKRDNILITRSAVPAIQGVNLANIPKVNMGKVDNHGFEIELNYEKKFGRDLSFSLQGNYGYNKNKVIYSDEPMLEEDYVHRYRSTGYAIGQVFGYKIDWGSNGGYWVSEEEIEGSGLTYDFGIPRVGDFKYVDQNNDDVINSKDQVPIGYSSRIPRNIFGLTLSVDYKAFDLMVFFQGVSKYSKFYSGQGVYESSKSGMFFGFHKHAWTEERYQNGDKITYPALSLGTSTNHVANDFFIMDRSFIRLRNIEIGYTLPPEALKVLGGISKLRLYAGGQNLFTWHKLRMDHLDPETNSSIGYPNTKMFNFGCYVTF